MPLCALSRRSPEKAVFSPTFPLITRFAGASPQGEAFDALLSHTGVTICNRPFLSLRASSQTAAAIRPSPSLSGDSSAPPGAGDFLNAQKVTKDALRNYVSKDFLPR